MLHSEHTLPISSDPRSLIAANITREEFQALTNGVSLEDIRELVRNVAVASVQTFVNRTNGKPIEEVEERYHETYDQCIELVKKKRSFKSILDEIHEHFYPPEAVKTPITARSPRLQRNNALH